MSWAWWNWPLTWLTNHCSSVLWHYMGHLTHEIVPKITYSVSSGTWNSAVHTYIRHAVTGGVSDLCWYECCLVPFPLSLPTVSASADMKRVWTDGSYMESDLACLTNTGEVHVYTVPHLRRQLRADCISRENIMWVDCFRWRFVCDFLIRNTATCQL